jgi:hypothetical protein
MYYETQPIYKQIWGNNFCGSPLQAQIKEGSDFSYNVTGIFH